MHEVIEKINIEDMIYEIKGKQVMIDSDLASLYQVETKRINEAVKNNPLKFPERFCFKITEKEYLNLKSKISTSSLKNTYGGSRKGHTVFTEQGVAMLATILKSNIAIEVSIKIMDAFIMMRNYISNNVLKLNSMYEMLIEHDKDIKILQESFDKLESKKLKNEIYFNGQIYDAYSKIIDILNESKQDIIIIDNYADKSILDIIKNINKNITIITRKNNLLKEIDVEKYNKQYHNLNIIYNNTFHDRFIILDKNIIYHLGSSINYIGSKTFAINIIEEEIVKKALLTKIKGLFK